MKYFPKKLLGMKYLGLWFPGLRNVFVQNSVKTSDQPAPRLSRFYILNVRSLSQ